MIDNTTIAEGLRRLADHVEAGVVPTRAYPEIPLSINLVMDNVDDVDAFAIEMNLPVSIRERNGNRHYTATKEYPGLTVTAFWIGQETK